MKLVIEDEAGTRSTVPFAAEAIVVGRASEATFRLGDRNVSRRHARFVLQSGSVFVEDLGSLTGTRVNGERISGRRKLREGDLVQIGDYDLAVLHEQGAAAGPGAPPPLPVTPREAVVFAAPERAAPRPPPAPAPPRAAVPAPRPPPPARPVGLALAAGALALAVGIAAGFAVGALTAPPPPPAPVVTRP
jgi:predicted component of type VI protein secretion system